MNAIFLVSALLIMNAIRHLAMAETVTLWDWTLGIILGVSIVLFITNVIPWLQGTKH